MLKRFQEISSKLSKDNGKITKNDFDLPEDYVVAKFYELGHKVSLNRYSGIYNCCCPICKEGKSWGRKKRCFYIPENDNIYCHNCGWSSKPYNWIKTVSNMSHKEIMEEVSEGDYDSLDVGKIMEEVEVPKIPSLPDDCINLMDSMQLKHYASNSMVQSAIAYIKARRLDTAINKPDAFYFSLKDSVHRYRLVIPFKDDTGKIVYYQSRKLFEWDKLGNYISKSGGDKAICGLDAVSLEDNAVFIFEGPFDSFFVKNGIAVAGITKGGHNLTPLQEEQMDTLRFFEKIWVLDSQWLDDTAREKTQSLIDQGEKVFFWPEKLGKRFKDFNEMCITLKLDEISSSFIKKNSHRGLVAVAKFKILFGSL